VLLYGDSFDATHHWFSLLLAMLAILLLSPARSLLRLVTAATAIALAAFCTQTTDAMTLLACCTVMIWEQRSGKVSWDAVFARIAFLIISSGLVWLILSWRFIADAGLSHYWFAQVIYPQKYLHAPHEFLNPQLGHPGGAASSTLCSSLSVRARFITAPDAGRCCHIRICPWCFWRFSELARCWK